MTASQPPAGRPQPVLSANTVSAILSNVLAVAVALGFVTTAESGEVTTAALGLYAAVAAAISVGSHLVAAVRARRKVTPLTAPRDDAGNRLVPAGSGGSLFDREADAPGL